MQLLGLLYITKTIESDANNPILTTFLWTPNMTRTNHRTQTHDDSTINNNMLTADWQIFTSNQESKQVGPDTFPFMRIFTEHVQNPIPG